MDILTISGLSKQFGQQQVLKDLSFHVPEGSIYGFIGKNGSGKTTTMKIVLGLLKGDSGSIEVCGEKVKYGHSKTNRYIGYLPDVPEFYNYMTSREYLKLCGEITGIPTGKINGKSDELLSLVGLSNINKRIGAYSRGMKQRLGIAQALLNEPKLLICDEPTSALDPLGRKEILDILQQVKEQTTVIFSTHVLSDVEAICDRIGILDNGTIKLAGDLKEIKLRHHQNCLVICLESKEKVNAFVNSERIRSLRDSADVQGTTIKLKTERPDETMSMVMNVLVSLSIIPSKIEIAKPQLQDIFMEVVE
ncbi:ABC transporter ATP-binding protein [Mesobacillus zeae]|uniref:ABC transporter ATP-binding protein n=1 Tax=Mesobacillus zeae TaxID=1917180 RepID=A0A398B6P9_9BACI|nr:ABC transporter ATP-binding protein [Mesobacillus zeae]RID83363.1 ABC transporter ATP-binding protein [Mesobacillus zeae]